MNNNNMAPAAIKKLAEHLGCSEEEVKAAVQSGEINRLLSRMDQNQAGQINRILADPESAKKIIESPQAQALIKKFFGG